MTERLSFQNAALLALFIAAAGIASALAFQHIGGYTPCYLCYLQRYAYYAGIPLAVLSLIAWNMGYRQPAIILLALFGLGFVINTGLGIYHSGVEWKWWPGPADCGGGDLSPVTGDLLEALQNVKPVSCNDAPWRLLGLSFAGWNAVISACVALLCLVGIRSARTPA